MTGFLDSPDGEECINAGMSAVVREVGGSEIVVYHEARIVLDAALTVLKAEGYRIVKLEQVGWRNPALTEPEDCPVGMLREPKEEWEGWTVPVFCIVEEGEVL
jgi:hypothetical protein